MTTRKPRGEQPSNHNAVKPCLGRSRRNSYNACTSLQTILASCSAPAVHVILQLTKIKRGLAPIGRAPRVPPAPADTPRWIRSFIF